MDRSNFDQRWWPLVEQMLTEMKAWRLEHPTASFSTIETALDARLHALRARMLEDLSLATPAALFREESAATRPRCPTCDRAKLNSVFFPPRHLLRQVA